MKKQTITIQLLIFAAIIVVANLLSNQLYFRLDFTEDQRYTLSDASKNILEELDGVITVTAYFSEDLPAQLLSNRKDFEDMLIEYESRSGGNVVYEFINPNESQEKEAEVQQKGISPIMINVRENDRMEQLRAYMGATLKMDDRTEIIPVIQPGAAMEYDLTTSIKKMSVTEKPKVALIKGHGEVAIETIPQLVQQLSVLYDVEPYEINDVTEIPLTYQALALIAPSDSIPQRDLDQLTAYINRGGKVFVAYTAVQGDLSQGFLSQAPDIGLKSWLASQGVQLGNDFLIDAQCATVTVTQQQGFFRINSQKEFPYFPRVTNYGDHPMTKGLDEVTFAFATNVTAIAADTAIKSTNLLLTSENSGSVPAPAVVDIQKKWALSDFGMGVQPIGVALEGLGNGLGRLIVIGNGDFMVNGSADQIRQIPEDHVSLASNAIDWLADDTGLIDLRTKGIASRPLDQIEDGTKNFLKYANVFAPIFLLLVYAFVRRLQNQRKRQQWMQGNYE